MYLVIILSAFLFSCAPEEKQKDDWNINSASIGENSISSFSNEPVTYTDAFNVDPKGNDSYSILSTVRCEGFPQEFNTEFKNSPKRIPMYKFLSPSWVGLKPLDCQFHWTVKNSVGSKVHIERNIKKINVKDPIGHLRVEDGQVFRQHPRSALKIKCSDFEVNHSGWRSRQALEQLTNHRRELYLPNDSRKCRIIEIVDGKVDGASEIFTMESRRAITISRSYLDQTHELNQNWSQNPNDDFAVYKLTLENMAPMHMYIKIPEQNVTMQFHNNTSIAKKNAEIIVRNPPDEIPPNAKTDLIFKVKNLRMCRGFVQHLSQGAGQRILQFENQFTIKYKFQNTNWKSISGIPRGHATCYGPTLFTNQRPLRYPDDGVVCARQILNNSDGRREVACR